MSSMPNKSGAPVARLLSVCACAVAFGFVLLISVRELDSVAETIGRLDPWTGVISVLALMVAMIPFGVAVAINLRMLGYSVSGSDGCFAFFLSQFGKYVPGKVWLFVIRGGLYSRYGVPLRASVASMAIEIAMYVASALAISLTILSVVDLGFAPSTRLLALLALSVLLACCSPPALNRLLKHWVRRRNLTDEPVAITYRHMLVLLAVYTIGWLSIGAAFVLLVSALEPVAVQFFPHLTAAILMACVAGYLMPLIPAGLGSREIVITGTLSLFLSPGAAVAAALMARVWWTLAELGCVAMVLLMKWIKGIQRRQECSRATKC